MSIRSQERMASLIAGAGVVWAVSNLPSNLAGLGEMPVIHSGPLEVCATGIVIWLIAKWRRSVQVR